MNQQYYYYEMQFNLGSRRDVPVYDQENNIIYFLQRYNKNWVDAILSARNPRGAVSVKLKGSQGQVLVTATEPWSFKKKFYVNSIYQEGEMIATVVNNLNVTNKQLEFSLNGNNYLISKEAFNNRTLIYEDEKIIGEMTYDQVLPPRSNYIKVVAGGIELSVLFCLLHTFELGVK
ncbi:tubby C-terminal domain-like protein [Alkalibacillus haloalkaliphilus]|uniref:Tubby C-terminal domain-containing protein n=1 Tax=Alkalibacillus haloalkaliphilus TaxID=94136 RepID=A0A511W7Y3_9BACI|nr:hypothetical protein [Alkalibacillus haloalkaliphilus]GEN46163.1 hypothetical protein AHA02nite_19390 [Alkalibacillus haloalkaliphilus]